MVEDQLINVSTGADNNVLCWRPNGGGFSPQNDDDPNVLVPGLDQHSTIDRNSQNVMKQDTTRCSSNADSSMMEDWGVKGKLPHSYLALLVWRGGLVPLDSARREGSFFGRLSERPSGEQQWLWPLPAGWHGVGKGRGRGGPQA